MSLPYVQKYAIALAYYVMHLTADACTLIPVALIGLRVFIDIVFTERSTIRVFEQMIVTFSRLKGFKNGPEAYKDELWSGT